MPKASCLPDMDNASGSALVVATLILVVLSAVCIFAASIVYKEMQVSGNDRFYRTAFYNADGAVSGTAKLLSQLVDNREKILDGVNEAAPGIEYTNSESDPAEAFLLQILQMEKVDDTAVDDHNLEFLKTDPANDFGMQSRVRVIKAASRNPFGGGAEFGAMAEGVGAQMVANVYRIESESTGPSNTFAGLFAEYWKLINVPGGL
jgi:hypothetical protein